MFRASAAAGVLFLAASLYGAEPASPAGPERCAALEAIAEHEFDPGSVLVRFAAGVEEQDRALIYRLIGGKVLRSFTLVEGLEHVSTALPVPEAVALLGALPGVEYAEPDYVVRPAVTPNDTYYGLLWGLHNTGQSVNGDPGIADADCDAPEAWDTFTGDPGFVIADIDTGLNYNHADIAANVWSNPGEVAGNGVDDDGNGYVDDVRGWDFFGRDNDPMDGGWHGSHTAGTIGAVGNNGLGVTGVNWRCKIMPLRFLGPNGGYTSDAVLAVQYCTRMGVKVSNNSWGGGGYSQALYDAVAASRSVGHVFVAAAGNGGADQVGDNNDALPYYPASYALDNIISVAALNNNDGLAGFSNYGATSVDLGAPGVNVLSLYQSGYAWSDGTSMATPHVSGVVGLVYASNPGWTYAQVRGRVLSTVRPVAALGGRCATGGALNAAAAVGTAPVNTAPAVTISTPGQGASFVAGTAVTFAGGASDAQDGDLTASLVWTSSLQGQIGVGGSFGRADLVAGTHVVTAAVTDSGGLGGSATVTITITQPSASPPAAPSGTAASASGGIVTVRWTDNSGNETSFEVQRERRSGNRWTETQIAATVGANTTSAADVPGTGKFRYRVRAVNGAGASAWSAWANVNAR